MDVLLLIPKLVTSVLRCSDRRIFFTPFNYFFLHAFFPGAVAVAGDWVPLLLWG